MTEIGMVTKVERSMFLGVSHDPITRGGVQRLLDFWDPLCLQFGLTYSD